MDCTYDKPRSGQKIVSEHAVTEVHHAVTSGHMQTARSTARVLDILKTTVLKLIHSVLRMFPYWYQRVRMLQLEDPQLRTSTLQMNFYYGMMLITTGHFAYYERTRCISI